MSRIAKMPINIPKGVEVNINGQAFTAKGPKGQLAIDIHESVALKQAETELLVEAKTEEAKALSGTMRALVNNVVVGVSSGFERKLLLVGVGYRAQKQGNILNLTLGFSHPVQYTPPEGIEIDVPSQTEIIIKGSDKQKVGQVAAEIRAYRPPEPYKGKGVRYADETVVKKEAKKK